MSKLLRLTINNASSKNKIIMCTENHPIRVVVDRETPATESEVNLVDIVASKLTVNEKILDTLTGQVYSVVDIREVA